MEQYISNPEDPGTYTELREFRSQEGYHLIATVPLTTKFTIETITKLPKGTQVNLTFYCIADKPTLEIYFLYAKGSYYYWWAQQKDTGDFCYVSNNGKSGEQRNHPLHNPTKKGGYISLTIQRTGEGATNVYLNGIYIASRAEVDELSYFYNNKPFTGLMLTEFHMTKWYNYVGETEVFKEGVAHSVPLADIGRLGIGSVVSFTVTSNDEHSTISMQFIRHSDRESDTNDTARAANMGVAPRANTEIKGVCKMATFTATIWSDLRQTPIIFDNNEILENLDIAINNVTYKDIVMDVGLVQ
ncbi:uncharacterized protein LOC135393015 isoform X1 [Ornithodoros turicata]|uniref:uncharacterized protein LOC135393015 isoform X1 n=1 Tax=Ornithodoros turicata TaxID=34597 RepID=UPI0031390615